MSGRRPNAMQRLMRCWRELHPYNAIEVAEVEGRPDEAALGALSAAAQAFLEEHGLGREPIDVPVEVHPGGSLDDLLTGEMNRPFADGPAFPLRLFVLPCDDGGERHHVGFVVDHVALDGRSLAALARRVLDRAHGEPSGVGPLTTDVPGALRTFGTRVVPLALRSIGRFLELRTAYAPGSGAGLVVDVERLDLPGLLPRLRAAAAAGGVPIGAHLVSILAGALDAPTRALRTGRRRNLSIGVVADLARLAPRPWEREPLGVLLGYDTALLCDGRLERPRRGALASLGEIWLAQAIWPFVSAAERPRFHARQVVLSAGLSNLLLPAAWFPPGGRVRAWRSVSPCGPIAPLVLRVTTAGEGATASLTWRREGYPEATRQAIRAGLLERLA